MSRTDGLARNVGTATVDWSKSVPWCSNGPEHFLDPQGGWVGWLGAFKLSSVLLLLDHDADAWPRKRVSSEGTQSS